MNTTSFYIRNMLHQYDRQLVTARRLARYRQTLRAAIGEESTVSMEAKRKIMVERVARELFENLLFTGSDAPMVEEVRNALAENFGNRIVFRYPPGSLDLVLCREDENGALVEIPEQEREDILDKAWQITLDKVNDTML